MPTALRHHRVSAIPAPDPVPALADAYTAAFYASCALTAFDDHPDAAAVARYDAIERRALAALLNTHATSKAGIQAKLHTGLEMAANGGDDLLAALVESVLFDLDQLEVRP